MITSRFTSRVLPGLVLAGLVLGACSDDPTGYGVIEPPAAGTAGGPTPGAPSANGPSANTNASAAGPAATSQGGSSAAAGASGPAVSRAVAEPPRLQARGPLYSASEASSATPAAAHESHLLWQNTSNGDRGFWVLNGTNYAGWVGFGNVPVQWEIAATADLNGDNKPDILWQNRSTGERGFWLTHGSNYQWVPLAVVPVQWEITAMADVNADGKPDILWQNRVTGERGFWLMNGTNQAGWVPLAVVPVQWEIAAMADVNADGKPDILWQNRTTGERGFWLMNGASYSGNWAPLPNVHGHWDIAGLADVSGDNKPDILWQNRTTGDRGFWLMNGTSYTGHWVPLSSVSGEWDAAALEPIGRACSTLDLRIDGAYLTQSIQTYNGSVPLVANKNGVMRVFAVANQSNSARPTVRVRFYQNGTLVDTRMIPAQSTSVPTSVDEGSLVTSWNVAVPGSLITPGLSFLVDVDPDGAVPDCNRANNVFPASGQPRALTVNNASNLRVTFVPIRHSVGGRTGRITTENRIEFIDFSRRLFPVPNSNTNVRSPYLTNQPVVSNGNWNQVQGQLLHEMALLRVAEGATHVYYGVFNPEPNYTESAGRASMGQPNAIGVDNLAQTPQGVPFAAEIVAHELGHTFDRRHAPCNGAPGPDPNFPGAGGVIGAFGFDVSAGNVIPSTWKDLMGYCQFNWISPYTYTAVMNFRTGAGGASAGVLASAQPTLLVSGRMTNEGLVLDPIFEVSTKPHLPSEPGPFRLEGRDATGNVLFSFSFAGTEVSHAHDGERHFAFAIPVNPAQRQNLTEVRLSGGGRQPAVLTASAAPVLTQSATAGAVPLGAYALSRIASGDVRLRWDESTAPQVLIRDAATGQVISFARGGEIVLPAEVRELDLMFSSGVRNWSTRVATHP